MGDLLSLEARRRLLTAYSHHIQVEEVDLIFWLFHYGAGFPDGPLDRELEAKGHVRWRDAEEFLEVLDNARSDQNKKSIINDVFVQLRLATPQSTHPVRKRFQHVFELPKLPEPADLAKLARRMIAASCSSFLEGIDETAARAKERWLPYQQWLGLLREGDSILTFNYDRVVELLEPSVGPRQSAHSRWGVEVHGVIPDPDRLDEARLAKLPVLYKLHGSVNWNVENGKVRELKWEPSNLDASINLAIATPGDSKMDMAGGMFGQLWKQAETALFKAEEVYLIGFRFPASDAFPRDRLLAALRRNDRPELNVHVVLGPDQTPDLRRVLALLRWTVDVAPEFDQMASQHHRRLIAHSMWAEDFLSVWARNEARKPGRSMPWV